MRHPRSPAPRLWRLLCLAAAACGLAACGNLNSIHRDLNTASGTGVLIDAKQRAIIVSQRNGNIVCGEPSPDAMSAYAAEFSAELAKSSADGGNRSAAIKGALQEAAAFIGMRTPSIQLLRDSMYRTCEAYANGGSQSEYELALRRYQRYTVAMMTIEQLTQAGRVPSIVLNTEGSVGGERALSEWTGEIKRQKDLLDKQQAAADKAVVDGDAADAALKTNPNDTTAKANKAAAAQAKAAAEAEIAKIRSIIAALEKGMVGGTALAGRTAAEIVKAGGDIKPETIAAIAPVVESLAMQVLKTDDTGALCFEYLKKKEPNTALETMCKSHMTAAASANDLLAEHYKKCKTAQDIKACADNAPVLNPPTPVMMSIPGN